MAMPAAPPAAPELIEFTGDDRRSVLTVMRRLLRDRDGWVNLQPAIDPEDAPDDGTGLVRVFSASGPAIPLASWVPGARRRNGSTEPVLARAPARRRARRPCCACASGAIRRSRAGGCSPTIPGAASC